MYTPRSSLINQGTTYGRWFRYQPEEILLYAACGPGTQCRPGVGVVVYASKAGTGAGHGSQHTVAGERSAASGLGPGTRSRGSEVARS